MAEMTNRDSPPSRELPESPPQGFDNREMDDSIGKIGGDALGDLSPIPHKEDGAGAALRTMAFQRSDINFECAEISSSPSSQPSHSTATSNEMDIDQPVAAAVDLNESVTSTGSLREEEIQRTKEELGKTSVAFIERLRGAAFRRKIDLARARDSLAAKEKEQREMIAASKAARERMSTEVTAKPTQKLSRRNSAPAGPPTYQPFRARPLPVTNGTFGTGGLSGVPKVEKKQATTPFSPLLGMRRKVKEGTGGVTGAKDTTRKANEAEFQFHALPLPLTTGPNGRAGVTGVPKVKKRPVTVPHSPLLGWRRDQASDRAIKATEVATDVEDVLPARSPSVGSQMSRSSHDLLGLELMSQCKENELPMEAAESTGAIISDNFCLASEARSKLRSGFDAKRDANQRSRKIQGAKERKQQIQALKKELRELRLSI